MTPPTAPTTPPPGGGLTLAELRALAASVGIADPVTAAAIAMAESRGQPTARNITSQERSFGLWQVNTLAHPEFDETLLLDPTYNARAALILSSGGTRWTPWSTFNSKKYLQYMGDLA